MFKKVLIKLFSSFRVENNELIGFFIGKKIQTLFFIFVCELR